MLFLSFLESLVLTAFSTVSSWNSNIANDNTNSYLGQKWKWPFENTNSNIKNVVQWLSIWEPRFNTQDCWRTHHPAAKTSSPANRATTFFLYYRINRDSVKRKEKQGGLLSDPCPALSPRLGHQSSAASQSPSTLSPLGDPLWSCQKQKFQSDSLVGFIGNTTCCKEYS